MDAILVGRDQARRLHEVAHHFGISDGGSSSSIVTEDRLVRAGRLEALAPELGLGYVHVASFLSARGRSA